MRLALGPIVIRIDGEGVTLSPSLRAATRIAIKHVDFTTSLRGVLDGNITMISELITEGTGEPFHADRLFAQIAKSGIRNTLPAIEPGLTEFVLALAGYDPDAPAKPSNSSGPSLTLTEYHAKLFEVATGWLGWSPAEAWAATPAEIEAGFGGRLSMLKAIYGSGDDDAAKAAPQTYTPERVEQAIAQGKDPAFNRARLHALKNKNRVR